jgi:putative nucleotidyltransferase with HDIG domain
MRSIVPREQTLPTQWSFPFCPTPPDWRLEWERIQEQFAWIRAMGEVPQDALYHAEGDVLIHTRMVAESLIALEEWRALPAAEREVLFAAALLHDVAKPACTAIEFDGKITSKRHAQKGELLARELLWLGNDLEAPAPFKVREQIAKLVRHHGLPLWFLEKSSPAYAVMAASQTTRLDHLALLAEADVRGRICADQQELQERVELFRVFAQEQECYSGPRAFPSAQSRFQFFHSEGRDPTYAAYDDTRCEVVLMSGLPGAGKDTWIQEHLPDWPVISLDRLRKELRVSPDEAQGPVVQAAKEQAREFLRKHQSFVWNATNVTRLLRSQLIDLFASYQARVRIVYIEAPFDEMLRRNSARPNHVPEAVMYSMLRKLEVPDLTEAHQVEWVRS